MVIAFCTAVMNRGWQIASTLPENLERLRGTTSFVALCDYHSAEPLDGLVEQHLEDVKRGTLVYFRTTEPAHFHASKAKNLAHRLGLTRSPDVLFNLDADNYLSDETLRLVEETFPDDEHACLHNWSTREGDGTCGRIALRASDWLNLGGYDEQFLAMSMQDLDLIFRCRAAGLRYVRSDRGMPRPLQNTITQKMANVEPTSFLGAPATVYSAMVQHNLVASFGRPARLPLSDQRPFEGLLNLTDRRTL
jgi:hypothetical protein